MPEKINIEDFLERSVSVPVIDVRSPSEFRKGHIPGAENIALFSDEERKIVGTLYKRSGRSEAIKKGFEIFSAKYSEFIKSLLSVSSDGKVMLYCWRGGMRSASVAWLLERIGIETILLEGGYKSFRRYLRKYFSQEFKLHILGGMTGAGKTEILKEIQKRGHQVVDLEAIACHKGSAFGGLGEEEQPGTEQFENLLLFRFREIDTEKIIWLENESQSIGKVFIPCELYLQMKKSLLINIQIPFEERIKRLVREYSVFTDEQLDSCMQKILKKIGGQNFKKARVMLEEKDYSRFAAIALHYYDKSYSYGLEKKSQGEVIHLHSKTGNAVKNAELVEKLIYKIEDF